MPQPWATLKTVTNHRQTPGPIEMALSVGFPSVAATDASILILGSLPGRRSLEAQEYYAQPQNCFWKIMDELFGAGPELPYAERLQHLTANRIALWDVVASAQRSGSLDTAIVRTSVQTNDFHGFLSRHTEIGLVCFNGVKAAELYRRHVLPTLDGAFLTIRRETLPSTSPAHAAMPYSDKLRRWSTAIHATR